VSVGEGGGRLSVGDRKGGGPTYSPAMTLGALPQRRRYWLLRGARFEGEVEEEGRASVGRGRSASRESVAID
jgi:hypothetical protein